MQALHVFWSPHGKLLCELGEFVSFCPLDYFSLLHFPLSCIRISLSQHPRLSSDPIFDL